MRRTAFTALTIGVVLAGCPKVTRTASPPPTETAAKPSTPEPAKPVARVNGQVITDAELMAEAKTPISAAEAKFAEEVRALKGRILDAMIEQRLLEARAASEGITVDLLLVREVTSKIQEPTEAYLLSVYEHTKANGRSVPPFPDVKAEIALFVKGELAKELRQSFVGSLRAAAQVETLLPPVLPPKVAVTADGPSKGDRSAPVTIVEFSDYECPYCSYAEQTIKRVMDAYPGKVRVTFQSFPLSIHQYARKASEAALCAGEQGKYWEMHDKLFANQAALKVDDLKAHARQLELEPGSFDACLDSGRMAGLVETNRRSGEVAGVTATPTFFINGRPISGSQSFERFKEIIDYELSAPPR